ncbi:MAG: ATP-binding cassette domain-containing protein [Verrucomicrobia bacterium]|nr:ATP-binding cassette domain-containing protein [Verrucomicrobiota bacterium]
MTAKAPTSPMILEMIDAAVVFAQTPGRRAVEGITWQVSAGDYWVVGGLPGSGKSDLLATAAGLQRPWSGRHLLFGRDLTELHEDELLADRLRIGLVFENGGRLFNHLTVAENIALPLRYHRDFSDDEIQQRLKAILDLMDLNEQGRLLPSQTTRAMRQRAALARALALQPDLLLFDNPLGGLDRRQARWWLDFLARLAAGHEFMNGRPVTLVVTTEDLQPWFDQGRQFALLKRGRWVPLGARAELAAGTGPLQREWQELVGDGEKN